MIMLLIEIYGMTLQRQCSILQMAHLGSTLIETFFEFRYYWTVPSLDVLFVYCNYSYYDCTFMYLCVRYYYNCIYQYFNIPSIKDICTYVCRYINGATCDRYIKAISHNFFWHKDILKKENEKLCKIRDK